MEMNLNEESNLQTGVSGLSFVQTPKTAKISGMLSLAAAVLALFSIAVPFISAFLYWNFLLISAALAVFGFLEFNSRQNWFSTITWMISFVLLFLLFIFAFGSFENRQSYFFYATFSIIVPILLTINSLTAKGTVAKSFTPLLVPVIFIISLSFFSSRAGLFALLLLPIGWGLFGILNYLGTTKS